MIQHNSDFQPAADILLPKRYMATSMTEFKTEKTSLLCDQKPVFPHF